MRTAADKEKLPTAIKSSNALIMEVISSKGLEFEDVLLVDVVSSMPDGKDWRVLLSYLNNELETHAAVKVRMVAGFGQLLGGMGVMNEAAAYSRLGCGLDHACKS